MNNNEVSVKKEIDARLLVLDYLIECLRSLKLPDKYQEALDEISEWIYKEQNVLPPDFYEKYDFVKDKLELTTYYKLKENIN